MGNDASEANYPKCYIGEDCFVPIPNLLEVKDSLDNTHYVDATTSVPYCSVAYSVTGETTSDSLTVTHAIKEYEIIHSGHDLKLNSIDT